MLDIPEVAYFSRDRASEQVIVEITMPESGEVAYFCSDGARSLPM